MLLRVSWFAKCCRILLQKCKLQILQCILLNTKTMCTIQQSIFGNGLAKDHDSSLIFQLIYLWLLRICWCCQQIYLISCLIIKGQNSLFLRVISTLLISAHSEYQSRVSITSKSLKLFVQGATQQSTEHQCFPSCIDF